MSFVTFDQSGNVNAMFSRPQPDISGCVDLPDTDPRIVVWNTLQTKITTNQGLQQQLSLLDATIPRGLEDFLAASGFDTTKLPAAAQAKLALKASLRAQIIP